jgi:hypothetical protein
MSYIFPPKKPFHVQSTSDKEVCNWYAELMQVPFIVDLSNSKYAFALMFGAKVQVTVRISSDDSP